MLHNCLKTSLTSDICQSAQQGSIHLEPSLTSKAGHQVIFPGIRFSCHGYIDSWSALTILDIRYVKPFTLSHHIFLQVWRPVVKGKYHLVGSEELKFGREELSRVHRISNSYNAYFAFTKKSGTVSDDGVNGRIHFKPGDVIGSFVPARLGSLTPPLSFVYSLATEGGGTQMVVDILEGVACEINECGGDKLMDSDVIPWISMKTGDSECVSIFIYVNRIIMTLHNRGVCYRNVETDPSKLILWLIIMISSNNIQCHV